MYDKSIGSFVKMDSGEYYRIENTKNMPAFFINVSTASDIWMFLSSNGGITAGRQNSDGAVFPYETDDRLHLAEHTGPKTVIRMEDGRIWEPFNTGFDNPYTINRSYYKRLLGDAVLFEERNECLGLTFSYRWETCEKYGIVRTACLENENDNEVTLSILDGVENIMPFGIHQAMSESSSCLSDSYKACERPDANSSLAVFSLTSMIMDSPEPIEVLRATTVWHIGKADTYALSSKQNMNFVEGGEIKDETNSVGRKGAYLASQKLTLAGGEKEDWLIVMDARVSQNQVSELMKELSEKTSEEMRISVESNIARGSLELKRVVAIADGLQLTANKAADIRHYMNVLYNNMRGGVFMDGYAYDPKLLSAFVASWNREIINRRSDFFNTLPVDSNGEGNVITLYEKAYADGDPDVIRLVLEFLPLAFSRRHGDPSRPWNRFNIRVKDDNGNRVYHYEGNWRDIFQNWEAMALSFPGYIAPIIAKFLNASTIDGFNPYRITKEGIDWEVPQPDNPFSGLGYWGDHQIVYLTKLLEWLQAYAPDELGNLMHNEIFTYAEVPYELKPYADLIKNGKDTLFFDKDRHDALVKRAEEFGSDGKLLMVDGNIYHVSFVEKILVPILSKLSNLVPGGGIWMNTQRPEWNDANNAIVGHGLSMVTVYQLYRHLALCRTLIERSADETTMSTEVVDWLRDIYTVIKERCKLTPRAFLDKAGTAFSEYRHKVYAKGYSGKIEVSKAELLDFIDNATESIAESIDANKREDGMYHGYNILKLTDDGLIVSPMFLMLEAQSSVLGSGRLTPDEALELVEAMEKSDLLSDEHATYFLYPRKRLKTFMEKNIIPPEMVARSKLIAKLLDDKCDELVIKDAKGNVRFHESIRWSVDLNNALAELSDDPRYKELVSAESDLIHDIFEHVFEHNKFTGRSGIMYKYEGIGSIYWHQNSKFILSFQEMFTHAAQQGYSKIKPLKEAYYRQRAGLGFNKEPSVWGAFPLEPYSHTPYNMPAQQPGMTGQVKEDILTRNAELGLTIRDGQLIIEPALLDRNDFISQPEFFSYINLDGNIEELALEENSLAFTVCQVPFVYKLSTAARVVIYMKNGDIDAENSLTLCKKTSRSLFTRDGEIEKIIIELMPDRIV